MKRKHKTFYIIKYVKAASVKDALKEEQGVLAIIQKDAQIQQLAEAIGFEFNPYGETNEEFDIGF